MRSEITTPSSDDWYETTWGELVELKYGKGLREYKDAIGKFPVYGTNGAVGWCDKPLCEFPSIIIGRKGAYRGVHYSDLPFYVIDTAYFTVPKKDINLKWAYYNLLTQDITGLDSGSAIPSTRREDFYHLPVRVPPLKVQDEIVSNLDSLNNKIAINRQINQTLESMAQTIFKSWFVDFEPVKAKIAALKAGKDAEGVTRASMRAISGKTDDELDRMQAEQPENYAQLKTTAGLFPAAMQDSGLGGVPEGGEVVNLKELSKIISKGTTPSKNQVANAEDSLSISFIKVKDIADDGQINRAGLELIHESIHKGALKRSMLEENDLLFSIAGTIGRVSIVENDLHNSNINQALAFIRLNGQEHLSLVIEHLKSKRIQESAMASVVQGVQANVSLTSVGSFQIIVPKEPILAAWNEVVLPLHTEKLGRQRQNRLLSQLRDTLLPKLLSGELSVDALKITNEQGE